MLLNFYQCDRCGKKETVALTESVYYRLDDGRQVGSCAEPAWCFACHHVRSVERIPDLDRLEALLVQRRTAEIDDEIQGIAKLLRQTPEAILAERVEDRVTELEWRRARKSPPKCLKCGGSDFLVLWPDSSDTKVSFAHPTCAGTFRLASKAIAREISSDRIVLDPEGYFLEDE